MSQSSDPLGAIVDALTLSPSIKVCLTLSPRSIHRVPHCNHPAATPSNVDATKIARTRAEIRAKSNSRRKRKHTPIVATRRVGSAINRTIPVETSRSAPDRALAPNMRSTIPIAMSQHDAPLPRLRSHARRPSNRSAALHVGVVMPQRLCVRPPLRKPSESPGPAARLRRPSEVCSARRTPGGVRPEAHRRPTPGRQGPRSPARSRRG